MSVYSRYERTVTDVNDILAELLTEFIESSKNISAPAELEKPEEKLSEVVGHLAVSPEEQALIMSVKELVRNGVRYREKLSVSGGEAGFSEAEKSENALVQQLLDKNLFTYHFQPIVSVRSGGIYAYEALMRADVRKLLGAEGAQNGFVPTPFHILKYSRLSDRLAEVEQYTFLNVLHYIAAHSEEFAGKAVFINSMPNVHILPDKAREIEQLLGERPARVVVEMVESSEFGDNDLNIIKEKYGTLGIPIAIDDYGTGYSNISNLLRYTPNYVKIDRSLLSGIETDPNKKHFVREIIDFCHDNGIMALAEGVESSAELRTVILLGADLIQGYYTARPSPEVISEIPYEIREEIRLHRQEREDGRRLRIYKAEKDEHISLSRLTREGYSCIHIGFGYEDGRITVSGSPHSDSGIHIVAAEGFGGTIVLENARLSNLVERPCIAIGSKSRVTLSLIGSNRLDNSGICVPETAELKVEGQGSLDIRLGSGNYYGIGGDLSSRHGKLEFVQDGTISITAKSHAGVCIGSGLGGTIVIGRGRYVLSTAGSSNVGIGCYAGMTDIDMLGCDFECSVTGAFTTAIGSIDGESRVHIMYSSIRCSSESQLAVSIGSIRGRHSVFHADSVSLNTGMRGNALTAYGSLNGSSEVTIERSSVNIRAEGASALAFGGLIGGTKLSLADIDLSAELSTEMKNCIVYENSDVVTRGGRYRIKMGGRIIDKL